MDVRVAGDRRGDVTVVRLVHEDNRFHPDMVSALGAALDDVEAREGPKAVVLTGTGKFFSNGLDLEWLGGADDAGRAANLDAVEAVLGRVLAFPAPVVAAVNGHAFAAGLMLALCADLRVMRADRGFLCLPEVDLGLPFRPFMNALITGRLAPGVAHQAMVFGPRYTAEQALALGMVDAVAAEARVLDEAVERAAALAAKAGPAMGTIKRAIHAAALDTLP